MVSVVEVGAQAGAETPQEKQQRLARQLKNAKKNLGLMNYYQNRVRRKLARELGNNTFKLSSKEIEHAVRARIDSSDPRVFSQIFSGREYSCLDELDSLDFVIDCGANVGYSSAYFLSRFPQARVVAIEPDQGNFKLLQANTLPYAERCELLNTGVWSHTTGLVLDESRLGKGQEWGREIRPCRDDEAPQMQAIDIGSVIENSAFTRVSLLKIDVEGAEREIFARNYQHWLPKVDNLVIELHGRQCEKVFHSAIENEGFDITTSGELTVCKRPFKTPF